MGRRLTALAAVIGLLGVAGCEGGFAPTGDPNVAEMYPRGTGFDYDDQGFLDADAPPGSAADDVGGVAGEVGGTAGDGGEEGTAGDAGSGRN